MKSLKITFQFNSRSSGQNVPAAKAIAEKCNGIIEDRFYKIQFDSPEDDNLKRLYELVGKLKGSQISIDDGEPISAPKIFNAVNCQSKLLCKGLCNHVLFGYYPINQIAEIYTDYIEKGVLSISDERLIRRLSNFLVPIEENRFRINKELFLTHFQSETEMESILCPKYKLKKIESEIDKLPDEIILKPEEEEENLETFIKNILTNCEIDSDLPFEDILNCSKAVFIILLCEGGGIPLQNTDIYILSFPLIKDLNVLLKLIIPEDTPELSEESELKKVVIKENDLYFIKTPLYRIYFQIFSDNDLSKADASFKQLKKIK